MKFCWLHKWKQLNEAKITPQSGGVLKEYQGFEKYPVYFATINNKHPAYSDFIKLQPQLATGALQTESSDINIPLFKHAEDKVCERCGLHILNLQKEIKIYYNYLKTSSKLKDWIRDSTETALNDFWNQNLG